MKNAKPIHLSLSSFSEDSAGLIVKWDSFPVSKFPLHTHNFFEIELIMSGSGKQIINGTKYIMRPGMFYFLAPSDSHEVHYKEPASIINISFSHNFLPENFENLLTKRTESLVFYVDDNELDYLSRVFQTVFYEYTEKIEYFETSLTHYLSILLLTIARKSKISLFDDTPNDLLSRAISYIKLHFTENPNLNTVADHVNLTPAYFTTILKKSTGLSYGDYLTNLKIAYAKKLLKSNRHSITDIAFASGFNSICNFNRVFKSKTKLSPSQYRKKHLLSKQIDAIKIETTIEN